ncbi:MAG: LysM peptidoglycan-binding domain-containing protein [Bacteroidales bacterium]
MERENGCRSGSAKAFLMHTVVKGETLATIADKYGVTVRDIRKENKGLGFPKVNEIIRIPVERVTEYQAPLQVLSDTARVEVNEVTDDEPVAVETTEVRSLKGDFRIALLLPLYYNENSERIEIDSSQIIKGKRIRKVINRDDKWIYPGTMPFLELYQGVLIAADTLRSLGLDIDIHVYDIRGDTLGLTRLIESGDLRDMDLIVGPVYSRNLSIMAAYADRLGIPVVTPVPLRNNDVLTGHSSVFITNPTLEVAQRAIADRVSVIDSSNFIFIHADSANYDDDVNGFRSLLLDKLSAKYGNDQPRFRELVFYSRSTVSRDSIRRLERLMMPGYNNVVLIASEEPPVLSESVMDIHTLSKKYKVSLVGYPAMRDLENLDPKFYFDLGLELFSPYWIDYTSDDVVRFNRIYRQKFFTEPQESSFAWQGYDLTYYFISGLAMHGKKFLNRPEIHNPDLLSTAFRFIRHDRGDGFENQMLYLLKFSGEMELKKEGESWERSGK